MGNIYGYDESDADDIIKSVRRKKEDIFLMNKTAQTSHQYHCFVNRTADYCHCNTVLLRFC